MPFDTLERPLLPDHACLARCQGPCRDQPSGAPSPFRPADPLRRVPPRLRPSRHCSPCPRHRPAPRVICELRISGANVLDLRNPTHCAPRGSTRHLPPSPGSRTCRRPDRLHLPGLRPRPRFRCRRHDLHRKVRAFALAPRPLPLADRADGRTAPDLSAAAASIASGSSSEHPREERRSRTTSLPKAKDQDVKKPLTSATKPLIPKEAKICPPWTGPGHTP